ncbi:hypothetical protein WICPIJ_005732 [Wickerhamomyces pijperi]|uniref:EKC/KEOPS complex subunit CGI121 n=1 Tax=Wickerhamomyces pijperi TaxID=599730 RepID=A0A9P8Q2Y2_WICPI|nr:hypothetical protein WICPIJ_005732 [Wickerhamomyces pijperi]
MLSVKIPQFQQSLQIYYFENVENSTEIRTKLLSGQDSHNFAFVNPDVIFSKEQLLSACYRALLDYNSGKIRTRSIHSEIIFCLGSSGNIVDSLTRFGIKEDGNRLIILKVIEKEEDVEYTIDEIVKGDNKDLDDALLRENVDFKQMQKAYKFQPSLSNSAREDFKETDWSLLLRKTVDLIQLRGC